jgi:UDP-N-acetylglucosamine 3-dehydrogenase
MGQTRHGVIGLGWFGEKHLEALVGNPGVAIYSLCTRTPERLAQVAERFRPEKTYTDYREMLKDPALDSVSITTMWDQHRDPAIAALETGKHVFLEKPMASSVEDCQAIVNAAAASSAKFMVGHICRFNPRYAAAKQAVDEGKLGRIVALYARRNLPAWVGSQVLDKIGPIIGDGVHDTDLMLWFTGARIVSAYGQTVAVHGHK